MDDGKPVAHLEDWLITERGVLMGTVTGHPYIPDATFIHTSRVVQIEGHRAETHNTRYTLGEPYARQR